MRSHTYFPFLIGLVICELSVFLSVDAFLPALPDLAHSFSIGVMSAQYAITAWYLGSALLPLLMGPIAEHFGYRPTLLAGALIFLLSNLLCTTAHTFTWFLAGRVIQGCCVAMVLTPGYATVHHLLTQKHAITTTAWMSAITVLAPAFGPLGGALILQWQHWPVIFMILSASTLIALLLLLPGTPHIARSHDYSQKLGTLLRQYGRIIGHRPYLHFQLARCSLFAILVAWITTSPILLMHTFDFTQLQFAYAQALVFGFFIMGTKGVKILLKTMEPPTLLAYTLIFALCFGILSLLSAWLAPSEPWLFAAFTAGLGLCAGLSLSSLDRLAIETVSEPMGMRIAMGGFLFSLFGLLGSAMTSLIRVDQLLPLSIVMVAFSCMASLLLFMRPKA